jgi:two-component system cell cycle sensor histidine kinase/response regulator CckA
MVHRDGHAVHIEMAGRRIVFQGQPAFVTIGRDITERLQLEASLAQTSRLAAIGTLAAGVGHELNNPLTYLQLNLDGATALLRDATLPAEHRDALGDYLAAAHEAARRMQEILAELRQFARPERAAPARADVNRAIEAAVRLTGHQVRLQAAVETELAATRLVPASEGQLTQIMVNLMMNAVQAMPEGQAHAHRITLRTWDDGAGVAMAVADTGAGMPPEVLAHVFEPFFTTKAPSAGAGTGLGLSICHSLVTGLGGRMDARSVVGQGTTFTVWLPAADGPGALASDPPAPVASPPPAALARPRVLLIDDEAAIRSVLQQLLVEDYEVEVADSGRAAMAVLARDQAFAAIVCDMTMPDVGGAELWGWIEAHHPRLLDRLVLMSGGTSAGGTALLQRFPDRWLHKPFSLERLQRAVAERVAASSAGE